MVKNSSKNSRKKPNRKIQFNSEKHQYVVDGKVVPSVSEIMKPLTEGYYKGIPKYILKNAQKRGTAVHEAIENYILFDVISEKYRGYVEQFITFVHENALYVDRTEMALSNGVYAGTVDLVLKRLNGKLILVDIKTTNVINESLVKVQLNAYKDLLLEYEYNIEECSVLHLKEDSYNFVTIEPDKETWSKLLNEYKNKVHKHKNRNEKGGMGKG